MDTAIDRIDMDMIDYHNKSQCFSLFYNSILTQLEKREYKDFPYFYAISLRNNHIIFNNPIIFNDDNKFNDHHVDIRVFHYRFRVEVRSRQKAKILREYLFKDMGQKWW